MVLESHRTVINEGNISLPFKKEVFLLDAK